MYSKHNGLKLFGKFEGLHEVLKTNNALRNQVSDNSRVSCAIVDYRKELSASRTAHVSSH
jgi:hypothetical protein